MILLGAKVITGYGLHSLIQPHHNHDEQENNPVYNTKCANSQIAIIFFQTFVNENNNEACCQIHQERRHTDSDGVFYDCTAQFVNASAEMKQLVLVGEGLELPHQ